MESIDSSPSYVKSTSRFAAKKENSPGGSECDDNTSITSSIGKSAIKGPKNAGIKSRSNNKKALKNFGSVRSFRRRAKTKLIQSPAAIESDDAAASCSGSVLNSSAELPHYLKATSSSQGKKMHSHLSPQHSESPSDGNSSTISQSKSSSPNKKPLLSRTSSIRNVRFLVKKRSFKPKRAALNYSKVSEDASVDRATYSSTVKDSKFPEMVEIHHESGKLSAMKVCRYHHCSLHGHCHGAHDPASQPKRSLYRRRWSLKKQRSMKPKIESTPGTKQSGDRKKELQKSRVSAAAESSDQEVISNKTAVDSPAAIPSKQEAELFGGGYDNILGSDLFEVAFGEMSFPERSYQENLSLLRKYSFGEDNFGGTFIGPNGCCLRCSCHNQVPVMTYTPRRADADPPVFKFTSSVLENGYGDEIPKNGHARFSGASSSFDKPKELGSSNHVEDDAIQSCANDGSSEDCPAIPVTTELTENNSMSYSPSYSQTSSHISSDEEVDVKTESPPDGDSKVHEDMQESVTDSPAHSGIKLQFSKQRHISMWHLIHQHMSSNMGTKSPEKPLQVAEGGNPENDDRILVAKEISASDRDLSDSRVGIGNTETENQDIELRKLFAIKLVREAIEKILLPEVQDQASDDQSVTSEITPRTELVEKSQSEVFKQDNFGDNDADKGTANASSKPMEESHTTDDAPGLDTKETHDAPEIQKIEKKVVSKSEKKAPKHWNNLKKWILLQRFIKALEKVRKFNPRKPHHLPLHPDPEAEKVNLRPQTVDGRKNAEEWMLDYALRQAVGQLAPTQKKKVALLVKAFETVVPPQEDIHFRITRLKDNNVNISSTSYKPNKSVSEDPDSENGKPSSAAQSLILDDNGKSRALENPEKSMANVTERDAMPEPQCLQEAAAVHCIDRKAKDGGQVDRKKHIKMWHMIYQHVVSGIAEKVGSRLLDGAEDDESCAINNGGYSDDSPKCSNDSSNLSSKGFSKSDAFKLIKDAVDEILLPDIKDDCSETQSVTSDSIADIDISERNFSEIEGQNTWTEDKSVMNEEENRSRQRMISLNEVEKAESQVKRKFELSKSKNWSKVKRLMLLKRSIKALEKARNLKTETHQLLPQILDPEPEKIELRKQMLDERKKAEQWMLDYAVQHIVTKLTPARKQRVSMLVEAFEAVVPFPET